MPVNPKVRFLAATVLFAAVVAFSRGEDKPSTVRVTVDVSEVPELKEWADKAKDLVEKWHPLVADMLRSDGFTAPSDVKLVFKKDMKGVAYTSRKTIVIAADWIRKHPDDYGMVIHELTHVVQAYRGGGNPGWLVEGVADYIRFFKYEPGKLGPINADRAHYNGSYRVTAAFLAYVSDKYDKELVRKLNQRMREGKYKEEVWKELTGKTVTELDEEWRKTLKR
jgi:hypothetical protein